MGERYTPGQIDALVALLRHLKNTLPSLRHIAGHEDLDTTTVAASDDPSVQVQRKLDPGPQFPWTQVMAAVDLERLP
ncbi:N-acetyl-anhydromuranmyl-L-alanine amidase [compost metagenome]